MITQHNDTYWTNRFGGRFSSAEQAQEDEDRREHVPFKIRVIGEPIDNKTHPSYGDVFYDWIIAIDDSKAPYTGQPDGTCRVSLFKSMIEKMQKVIDKHGDQVGYTIHHCGMGRDVGELVLLLPNEQSIST